MPILNIMGAQVGPKSMAYAKTYSDHRIMRAEKETSDTSKLVRLSRRTEKLAENNVFEETEGLLYVPGIADECKYKKSEINNSNAFFSKQHFSKRCG